MPVSHTCAACRATLEIDEQFAGRSANCPECQAAFVVPTARSSAVEPFAAQLVELPGPARETGNPYQSPADESFRSVATNFALLEEPLASRGTRWLGAIVDNALIQAFVPLAIGVMAWWGTSIVFFWNINADAGDEDLAFGVGMVSFFVVALVLQIIQAILVTLRGQTLGKMLLKMQLVDAQTGQLPGFVRGVLVRMLAPMGISFIPGSPLFLFMDAVFIFRKDHRRVVDHLARTMVISLRELPRRKPASGATATEVTPQLV